MALKKIEEGLGLKIYNLGTGRGTSVLEMIASMEKASGKKVAIFIINENIHDLNNLYFK